MTIAPHHVLKDTIIRLDLASRTFQILFESPDTGIKDIFSPKPEDTGLLVIADRNYRLDRKTGAVTPIQATLYESVALGHDQFLGLTTTYNGEEPRPQALWRLDLTTGNVRKL